MKAPLERVAFSTSDITSEKLLLAHRSVAEDYDPEEIAEYAEIRRRVMDDADHACRWHDSSWMKTSGTTSGFRKIYAFGPCFHQVEKFFDLLRTDGYDDIEAKIHISLGVGQPSDPFLNMYELGWVSRHRVVKSILNVSAKTKSLVFDDVSDGGRVCLWMAPSTVDMAAHYGFDLVGLCRPDRHCLYFTGEAVPEDLTARLDREGIEWRDAMRCWDGGATFYTCRYGKRHWVDILATTSVDEDGHLVSNDLMNMVHVFRGYRNGDVLDQEDDGRCQCGLPAVRLRFRTLGRNVVDVMGSVFSARNLWRCVKNAVNTVSPESRNTPVFVSMGGNDRIVVHADHVTAHLSVVEAEVRRVLGVPVSVSIEAVRSGDDEEGYVFKNNLVARHRPSVRFDHI